MARLSSETSVLGSQSQISGKVSGQGGLRIEGRVSGDISVAGPVEIVSGAGVEGDVSGASLELAGSLSGDARCHGPINVRSGADVRGDLKGSSVSIEPGARVDVRLDTEFKLDI
jgi:cytoskeletal protein CcmA (bactofilin family)